MRNPWAPRVNYIALSSQGYSHQRSLPDWAILTVAFLALLSGHLLLREYMPNPALGVVGFLLIAGLLGWVLLIRNDTFAFVMIIYVCSHFSFADNQGGLWALTAAMLIGTHFAMGMRRESFHRRDVLVTGALGILVLWNVMGWILRNPVPYVERLQGAIAFSGFLLVFLLVSNMTITPARFRTFLVITFAVFVYQFAVALNQRYPILDWNTPLLGAYDKGAAAIVVGDTSVPGTLRHSELFGEYGALFWSLLIPVLCSSWIQKELKLGPARIAAIMLLCLAFIAITSTRSAAMLAAATVAFYIAVLLTISFRAIDRFRRQVLLGILLAMLVPIVGIYVGLGSLELDMADFIREKLTTEGVLSGTAINRAPLFELALRRLSEKSWWIGNGFGTPRANLWAWTGNDPLKVRNMIADYHNLYLSLPPLYGWLGSMSFLWLIVLTAWRAAGAALGNRHRQTFLVPVAIGFATMWGVFLVDQFKISVLRIPTYHMMFWIWLGLTTAVVRTLTTQARSS